MSNPDLHVNCLNVSFTATSACGHCEAISGLPGSSEVILYLHFSLSKMGLKWLL